MTSAQQYIKGPFDKEVYWNLRKKIKLDQEMRAQQKVIHRPPVLPAIAVKTRDLTSPRGSATAVHFTKGYRNANGNPVSKRIRERDKKRELKLKHQPKAKDVAAT